MHSPAAKALWPSRHPQPTHPSPFPPRQMLSLLGQTQEPPASRNNPTRAEKLLLIGRGLCHSSLHSVEWLVVPPHARGVKGVGFCKVCSREEFFCWEVLCCATRVPARCIAQPPPRYSSEHPSRKQARWMYLPSDFAFGSRT